jgi:hypothetical protein
MKSDDKYEHWCQHAQALSELDVPEHPHELKNQIGMVERLISEIQDHMERYFEVAPKVKRYFEKYDRWSRTREERRVQHLQELLLKDQFIHRTFDKFEQGVWLKAAKFLGPLFQLRNRLRRLRLQAVEIGLATGDSQGEDTDSEEQREEKKPRQKEISHFPSPGDLKWGEVTLTFVSDDTLRIKARDITERFHFAEIGFSDRRKVDTPKKSWLLLREFASNQGELAWDDPNSRIPRDDLPPKVSQLRRMLNNMMGLEEDPFDSYHRFEEIPDEYGGVRKQKVSSYKLKCMILTESFNR